jgi:sterol desaturase/sphingolipid hydroxylase (fatty acid hydroxylase superfamily)
VIDITTAQTYRTIGFIIGLSLLLTWERLAPRERTNTRWQQRWRVNFTLLLTNSAMTAAICFICFWVRTSLVDNAWWWRPFAQAPMLRLLAEVLLLDIAIYWQHRWMHEIPWLWRFHSVHHSDLHLDVSSASRFHLGEILLSGVYKLVIVLALGVTLNGLVIFESIVLLAAQFQHANIRLANAAENALRWLLMTPLLHHLHHSQDLSRCDSNYGTLLSFWDRLWGSWRTDVLRNEQVGVRHYQEAERLGFVQLLKMPFQVRQR